MRGTAVSKGLELEAKFRLDEYLGGALPINVRSNLSLFSASVDSIPGPHNRLAQQPRYTANLGGDYRLRSLPLNLGASLNYTPATILRQTLETESTTSRKQVFDAYAAWNFTPTTVLRLSATNLGAQDYHNSNFSITPDDKISSNHSTGRTFTLWALRLEMKL